MQRLVKNASNARDRTLVFSVFTTAGAAADGTGLTLRIVGTETPAANASGTITRLDSGTCMHEIVISQAQSDTFAIGEEGMLLVPPTGGVQELPFPFLVCEDNPGVASPSESDIASAAATAVAASAVGTGILNANTALGTLATAVADVPTNAELTAALGTADDAVLTAIAGVSTKVDTVDARLDTEIPALTTNLAAANSALTALGTAVATVDGKVTVVAGYLDTEITALITAVGNANTALGALATAVGNVASASAAAVLASIVEPGLTVLEWLRRIGALIGGVTTGGGTGTEVFKAMRGDGGNGKTRVTNTISGSNRVAASYDDTDDS